MQTKQVGVRLLLLMLLASFTTAFCAAQSTVLTPDQALAIIRSQPQCQADSEVQIVQEFHATEDGAKLARLAVRTARAKHLRQFRAGILVRLLNNGGYAVLESDSQTTRPLRLYYLSRAADGRQLIDVVEIQQTEDSAGFTANDVQPLIQQTQVFMRELLTAQSYELSELVEHYFGQAPTFEGDDPQSYFAIPENVRGFATQREIEDLSALTSAPELWIFRHALSLPQFAANPKSALELAYDQRDKLIGDFLVARGIPRDRLHDLVGPGRVSGPQQLKEKLAWFRKLDTYLDAHVVPAESQWVFDLNLSLAGLPFDLGSEEEGFQLAVVPGLIPIWRHHPNGDFKLVALTEDE